MKKIEAVKWFILIISGIMIGALAFCLVDVLAFHILAMKEL